MGGLPRHLLLYPALLSALDLTICPWHCRTFFVRKSSCDDSPSRIGLQDPGGGRATALGGGSPEGVRPLKNLIKSCCCCCCCYPLSPPCIPPPLFCTAASLDHVSPCANRLCLLAGRRYLYAGLGRSLFDKIEGYAGDSAGLHYAVVAAQPNLPVQYTDLVSGPIQSSPSHPTLRNLCRYLVGVVPDVVCTGMVGASVGRAGFPSHICRGRHFNLADLWVRLTRK